MARRYRQEGFEADEPELNISSLIDVCFLLLSQQRVIDVVNALAGEGISNITFTDVTVP